MPSKWTLTGSSKAGEKTGFVIDELNIMLDCDISRKKTPNVIFISHSHIDHICALPTVFKSRTQLLKKY